MKLLCAKHNDINHILSTDFRFLLKLILSNNLFSDIKNVDSLDYVPILEQELTLIQNEIDCLNFLLINRSKICEYYNHLALSLQFYDKQKEYLNPNQDKFDENIANDFRDLYNKSYQMLLNNDMQFCLDCIVWCAETIFNTDNTHVTVNIRNYRDKRRMITEFQDNILDECTLIQLLQEHLTAIFNAIDNVITVLFLLEITIKNKALILSNKKSLLIFLKTDIHSKQVLFFYMLNLSIKNVIGSDNDYEVDDFKIFDNDSLCINMVTVCKQLKTSGLFDDILSTQDNKSENIYSNQKMIENYIDDNNNQDYQYLLHALYYWCDFVQNLEYSAIFKMNTNLITAQAISEIKRKQVHKNQHKNQSCPKITEKQRFMQWIDNMSNQYVKDNLQDIKNITNTDQYLKKHANLLAKTLFLQQEHGYFFYTKKFGTNYGKYYYHKDNKGQLHIFNKDDIHIKGRIKLLSDYYSCFEDFRTKMNQNKTRARNDKNQLTYANYHTSEQFKDFAILVKKSLLKTIVQIKKYMSD